jgi:hypothetical protein
MGILTDTRAAMFVATITSSMQIPALPSRIGMRAAMFVAAITSSMQMRQARKRKATETRVIAKKARRDLSSHLLLRLLEPRS